MAMCDRRAGAEEPDGPGAYTGWTVQAASATAAARARSRPAARRRPPRRPWSDDNIHDPLRYDDDLPGWMPIERPPDRVERQGRGLDFSLGRIHGYCQFTPLLAVHLDRESNR